MANPSAVITLSDFSPGIYGDYHASATPATPTGISDALNGSMPMSGAATIENTFKCCADSTGALVPLPKRVQFSDFQLPAAKPKTAPAYYPTNNIAMYTTDAIAIDVFDTAGGGTDVTSDSNFAFAAMWQYTMDSGGGASYNRYFEGLFYGPGGYLDFFFQRMSMTGLANSELVGANLATCRSTVASASLPSFHLVAGINAIAPLPAVSAMSANDQALTDFDTNMATGANYPFSAASSGNVMVWPKLATPATSDWNRVGILSPSIIIGHQGRIVAVSRQEPGWPGAKKVATTTIQYTATNNPAGAVETAVYGEENATMGTVIASQSADELLVIKGGDGGYLVRGDLNNPTVQRLPYLESTFGVVYHPASTPLGLVYTSRNGIFLWAGGDTSEKLSTQIDGFFFRHEQDTTNERYVDARGRLAYWHPWVAIPNNYLLDTRTKAWWRLDAGTVNESTPYNCYAVDAGTGRMLAFPYKITATQTHAVDIYDPTILTNLYSWQSQPLVETIDRVRSFQQMTLVASVGGNDGALGCTVTVTLTGYDRNGDEVDSVDTAFNFIDTSGKGRPIIRIKDIAPNFNAMYVQVRIVAESLDSDQPAPKIHAIHLHHRDGPRNPTG